MFLLILLGTSLPTVLSYTEPRFHDGFNRPIDLQAEESQGTVVQVIKDRNVDIKHEPSYYENSGTQGEIYLSSRH